MKVSFGLRFRELNRKRLLSFLAIFLDSLRENRRLMLLATASGVGAAAMRLLRPWPVKVLFDGVLMPNENVRSSPSFSWLLDQPIDSVILGTCLSLLVISLLWGLFSYAQTFLTARAGQHVVYSLRRQVYSHLLRLSLSFHQRRRRGDLVMRLTGDINLLRDMTVDSALLVVSEGLMLVSMIAVMAWMDLQLALVALSILPLMALTTFRFSVRIRDAARRQRQKEGRVAAMVSEMLQSVQMIQAFGREDYQESQFQRGNRKSLKAGLRTTRLEASMSRFIEVLLAIGTAGVLWLGVHRVQAGALTPGDLLVFTSYLHSSYRPLRKLSRVASRMSKAVVCAERVVEVLASDPEVTDQPGAKKLHSLAGRVEFRRVGFDYPGGRRVLRRINFVAEPGQLIGIAGPSGAGKSTLLALILRLYDPKKGKVLIDGRDIRRIRLQSLRDQITVVLQEPIIFGSTVRENIAFGNPNADDDEIERAAMLANGHDFIRELPDGYETILAEAGTSLSAGQRQRIAIARAFLRDAPILLMDEPTQGLDAASEQVVVTALQRLMEGRTTILIAHKLETLRNADDIFVIERGRIVEQGTHDELVAQGGWFARSWALQHGGVDETSAPADSDKVVAFEPRWPKKDDHLRLWAAGSPAPAARFDPAILDGSAVAEALARANVRSLDGGPLQLRRAWPLPRVDLVALYEDPTDNGKGAARWGIHTITDDMPSRYREEVKQGRAVVLEELHAIAHAFPNDPGLFDLRSLTHSRRAARELEPWFREVLEEYRRVRARVISYKPTRRCLIRYRLDAGEGRGTTLYGKCFPAGVAEKVWKAGSKLSRARRVDRLANLKVPHPVGLVSEHEMILWRRQSGAPFHELLGTEEAISAAPRVGALLADLHGSSTGWTDVHGPARELGTTAWWAGTAAAAFPREASRIERFVGLIRRKATGLGVGEPVPSHRDFYDKQVLVNGDSLALLDLETAGRADAELDVANFLVHLELRELQQLVADTDDLAHEFLEAYCSGHAVPDPERLTFYRTSALLRLAAVYALREGRWGDLSSSLVESIDSQQRQTRMQSMGG